MNKSSPSRHLHPSDAVGTRTMWAPAEDDNEDDDDLPPKPPPKDSPYSPSYMYGSTSTSTAVLAQRSQASLVSAKAVTTPSGPSKWYNLNGGKSPMASQTSLVSPGLTAPNSATSKSRFRLPRMKKTSTDPQRPDTGGSSSKASSRAGTTEDDGAAPGDQAISSPWGFQHNMHVDDRLQGMPTAWATTLLQAGYSPEEVNAIYAKRQSYQPRPSNASSSSSSRQSPVKPPSPSIVHPKPRKDSIRHLQNTRNKPQPQLPPPSSFDAFYAIDNNHLSLASSTGATVHSDSRPGQQQELQSSLGVHRAPSFSRIRRVPPPDLPTPNPTPPPPPYTLSPKGKLPSQDKPLPDPTPRSSASTTSASIRHAISTTLRKARSSASMRKSSDAQSPPPLPLGTRELDTQTTTVWDDGDERVTSRTTTESGVIGNDERSDRLSDLPSAQMHKSRSAASLRLSMRRSSSTSSLVPPRLELTLPEFDGFGSFGNFSELARAIEEPSATSSSPAGPSQTISIPRRTDQSPKQSKLRLEVGGSSAKLESDSTFGLDLANWGSEILSAVSFVSEDQLSPTSQGTPTSRLGVSVDLRSRTMSSPNPSTRPSAAPLSARTMPSMLKIDSSSPIPPRTSIASGTSSLLTPTNTVSPPDLPEISPLNLHPKKKPGNDSAVAVETNVVPDPSLKTDSQIQIPSPETGNKLGSTLLSLDSLTSPTTPLAVPPTPTYASLASPGTKKRETARHHLSLLIAEEYTGAEATDNETNGLLAYLQDTPSPSQMKFDPGQISGSTSSASAVSGSVTSSATNSVISSRDSANAIVESVVRKPVIPTNVKDEVKRIEGKTAAESMGQAFLIPASTRRLSSSGSPHDSTSRPLSTATTTTASPYDHVLDDWLEADDGERDVVGLNDELRGVPVELRRDNGLPSSPLDPISTMTPSLVISRDSSASVVPLTLPEEPSTDELPILFPLRPYIERLGGRQLSLLEPVAEGTYGAVFAARMTSPAGDSTLVAVKSISVIPEHEPKILSLQREVELLKDVEHENVLSYAALFVVRDDEGIASLWIQMELMERSLADLLAYLTMGLEISEAIVGRFANDILEGLDYLQSRNIAHRDVRSDNLLLSRDGVVTLADFSNATHTLATEPKRKSVADQPPYWMAPEMRSGELYDPHEVDAWSVGATVWELVEGEPPFINIEDPRDFPDRWPSLSKPESRSQHLTDFLQLCSEPVASRPRVVELLRTPFVRHAAPHSDIVNLLEQVRELEKA